MGLQEQLDDLQKSLDCLQESDKNLRLALKMGEMKCKETEIKYQLTSDRCLRLEQRNRRLDHKYRLLLRRHKELEKHLQKKAMLNQMMEQQSPGVCPELFENEHMSCTITSLSLPPSSYSDYVAPTLPGSIPTDPPMSISPSQPRCLSSPPQSRDTAALMGYIPCLPLLPPSHHHEAIQEATVTLRQEFSMG